MAEPARQHDAKGMSFPQRVWFVLSRVDVGDRLKKKTKFDYLPWADAWEMLMEHYPESTYSFDEPKFYENGTGEQWVHVTVKDGDDEFTRSWWLPFLDHANRALTNPSSLQINNTRMRALVKCIAMLGLGVHVFSGEDIPDKAHDEEPTTGVRTGARAAVMEDITLTDDQWATVREWKDSLKEKMPNKNGIDWHALAKVLPNMRQMDNDVHVVLFDQLDSWQRSAIKQLQQRLDDKARAEAAEAIKGNDDAP